MEEDVEPPNANGEFILRSFEIEDHRVTWLRYAKCGSSQVK